jgi:nitrate reductase NapD
MSRSVGKGLSHHLDNYQRRAGLDSGPQQILRQRKQAQRYLIAIKEFGLSQAQSRSCNHIPYRVFQIEGVEVNISGIVVHAHPDHLPVVQTGLDNMGGVEIHAISPDHKMVVTIEASDDRATTECFEQIRQLPGVLSASMVYHHFEEDAALEQEIQS